MTRKGKFTMKNKRLILSGLAAFAGVLPHCQADYSLGSAADFAVLAGTTVTSTGDTVLNGNAGDYPGATISGFGPGIVNGTSYAGGTVAQQAQADALAAYTTLAGLTPNQNLTGQDLGGLTLTPGVYNFTSAAQLTGTLTLNALGNPNAKFVFQIGSTLTTANGSSVVLENSAQALTVDWQVGTSATLGNGTVLDGSIIANTSITMNTGASLTGNVLALNGAVSLDDNDISVPSVSSVPEPDSFWSGILCAALAGAGLGLSGWRRKQRGVLEKGGPVV
jgi:type VI secretion system secreted protein VgrG